MSGEQSRKIDHTAYQQAVWMAETDLKLQPMEGIDMNVGLEYAGEDEELYREILVDYVACAVQQTRAIERAVAEEDHEAYTIEVHSLKSTSRTIGALELSNMAKELEYSSRNQEWETVKAKTPALLAAYRQVCLVIKLSVSYDEKETEKKPADPAAVCGLLAELEECLDEFDSVRAEEITAQLLLFEHTQEAAEYLDKLVLELHRFEYETCRKVVSQWRSRP